MGVLDLFKSKEATQDRVYTTEQMLSEMDLPDACIWIRQRAPFSFEGKKDKIWFCHWDREHIGARLEIKGADCPTMFEAVRSCYNKMKVFGVIK